MSPTKPLHTPDLTIAYNLLLSSGTFLNTEKNTRDVPIRVPSPPTMNTPSPIACLESYINPSLTIGTSYFNDATAPALYLLPTSVLGRLKNVGPARVKDMRALGQSMQILSHVPIEANAGTCIRYNDALLAAIQLNSDKFAALAILPSDGKEAARELQRCVTRMRFVGGVVGLQPDGRGGIALGNELEDLWSVAERFRVPVMLREMWPVGAEVCASQQTQCLVWGERLIVHSSQLSSPASQKASSHRLLLTSIPHTTTRHSHFSISTSLACSIAIRTCVSSYHTLA